MNRLTEKEILEIVFTEQFAEMKYKELTKDWEDAKRTLFYEAIRQKFLPMEILGLNWGIFLDLELSQTIEGYDSAERAEYVSQRIKEEIGD